MGGWVVVLACDLTSVFVHTRPSGHLPRHGLQPCTNVQGHEKNPPQLITDFVDERS